MSNSLEELERKYQEAEEGIEKLSAGNTWLIQLLKTDPERSIVIARHILQESLNIGYRKGVAYSYWILGRSYTKRRDFELALAEFGKALQAFEVINDIEGLGNVYHCLADVYDCQNNFEAASSSYANAVRFLEVQDNQKCKLILCWVLNGFGILHCKLADYSVGLACFYRALEIANYVENPTILTQTYVNISTAFMHVGDVSRSLESYNKALVLAQNNNNESSLAIIRINIGSIYYQFKDYQSALGHYLQALQFYSVRENHSPYEGLVTLNSNLGSVFEAMGNYSVALDYFSKALVEARKLKSKWGMMLAFHGIGCIYLHLHDTSKAEEYLMHSLALSRELDTRLEEAETLLTIGECRFHEEKYEEGIELLHQALELAYLLESPPTIAQIIEQILELPIGIVPKSLLAHYKRQYRAVTLVILKDQREVAIKQDLLNLEIQYSVRQMQAIQLSESEVEDMSSTLQVSNRRRVDSLTNVLKKDTAAKQNVPDTISVFTLGGFRLVINGREIDRNDWKNRKKARDIFKYLLLNHRKAVPFDTLIDVLWEDAGARNLLPSLWNAASVIRKILQPELPAQTQSQYLLVQDNCYTLNLGEICFIDFVEFQSLIASADGVEDLHRKIPYLEKAIALYQGDFLKEDQLAEWTAFEREKMKERYLNALMLVAEDCVERKQRSKATEYIRLALEADRVYEEAYTLLFTLYSPEKDRIEAQKWAKFCIDSYQREYGAAPPAALKKLMGIL